MKFSDLGSYWGAAVTIVNAISNDQKLESITITDTSDTIGLPWGGGVPINNIMLSAPAGSSGLPSAIPILRANLGRFRE